MKRLRYWRGLMRLRRGYCPACNSSPPDVTCPVCLGTHAYGHDLPEYVRGIWRAWWAYECGVQIDPPTLSGGEPSSHQP
jgi:hypothetical protein